MPKRQAFTLIEVMVAVMIVSIVIAALLQMRGNTSHKFFGIQEMMQTNQYNSFLLAQGDKYGFEDSHIDMNQLVDDFDLESDLRRKLKSMKISLEYETLSTIDTAEFEDGATPKDSDTEAEEQKQEDTTGLVFEIGKGIIKSEQFSTHLIRVSLQ